MRILLVIAFCVVLLLPLIARGQPPRGPMDYSVKQYGFILAVALLGGLVSWLAKVKKGQAQAWNIMQLVGELCTAAFAGLLCFWLCEWAGWPQLLSTAMVAISGHMGTKAISVFEEFVIRKWGVTADAAAQAGDKNA